MAMGEESKQAANRLLLIETLGNRIGFDHVRVFKPRQTHVPEYAFEQVEAVLVTPEWQRVSGARPIRLFTPPEFAHTEIAGRPPKAFKWRRIAFETRTAEGPERITPRWHCDEDLRTRDYWRVQTEQGRRLWLLSYPGDQSEAWYVAGEFP